MNKNFDLVLFLFGTLSLSGWTFLASLGIQVLIQQTFLLRSKGSPVVLQHPCTISTSTQSTATHGLMVFPHPPNCDSVRGRTHAQAVSSRTPTLATLTVVPSAILTGSIVHLLSRYHSLAATFTPDNLCSLGDSHTFHCHCLHPHRPRTLLTFKFTQQPLVYLIVWWVKHS